MSEAREPDPQTSAEDRQDAMAQDAMTQGSGDASRRSDTRDPRPRRKTHEDEVQDQLDAALADSFPASDPVSIATSQHEDWEVEPRRPA